MSRKIVIDASHGGNDFGISANGVLEKDISFLLSNYIYDGLRKLGYDVSLVRDSDTTLSDEERVRRILSIYGNSSDVILISNNFNSVNNQAQIIYALRNTSGLPNLIYDEFKKNNLSVTEPYQLRLPSDTALDYYYIHRNTGNIQPILIQYGNLNDSDFSNNITNNYNIYGDSVISAISSYLGSGSNSLKYKVVSGDTLYSIARKFNTTVDNLKRINNLSSNFLKVGDELTVGNSNSELKYVVKNGDTLYSIAKKYNTSVNEILKLNNLVSSFISVGQILNIPSFLSDDNYVDYIVKKGDNLYAISRLYDVSVNEIMRINGLSSNVLSIGQVLKVPAKNVYVVKKGDTLYSIARNYSTTVENIRQKNNLLSDVLSIGQKLII